MTTPERTPKQERQRKLSTEFIDLIRRFVLEDIVDPANGTSFTIVQADIGPPFEPLESIASRGQHVITVGIPNPDKSDFNELTMSESERVIYDAENAVFLEFIRELTEDKPDDEGMYDDNA